MNLESNDTAKLMNEGINLYIEMLGEKHDSNQLIRKEYAIFEEEVLPNLKTEEQKKFATWKKLVQLIHQSTYKNKQALIVALNNREKLTMDEIGKATHSFYTFSSLEITKDFLEFLSLPMLDKKKNEKEKLNGKKEKAIAEDKACQELVRAAVFLQTKTNSSELTNAMITKIVPFKEHINKTATPYDIQLQKFVKELVENFKTPTERETVIQTVMAPYLTLKERQAFYTYLKKDPFLQQIVKKSHLTKLELKAYVVASTNKSELPFKDRIANGIDRFITAEEQIKLKELIIQKEKILVLKEEMNLDVALRADKAFRRGRQRDKNFLTTIYQQVNSLEIKEFLMQRIKKISDELKNKRHQEVMLQPSSNQPKRIEKIISRQAIISDNKGMEDLHKRQADGTQVKKSQILLKKESKLQEKNGITKKIFQVFSNIKNSSLQQSVLTNNRDTGLASKARETKLIK
ncbi:hypothetical protein ACTNBL_09130 [Enterococcus villorum]|uniref:Uncharacterized protein n=2 Tax=Enterococcus villorum TaxID=112904 RepID=A0A511J2V5_9ENTE|nr:hypothetical protein [Enterococcus villorum]EOH89706.1 hypothetical protein UAO_01392 [Enterococcus villorum ATCC 700913]EOW78377.1 hypothetical protein I591_01233 [Enterococcus villorum ATCC 700913]GEL92347.1 hypothetical protein EVI01_16840 [Enterococcus villorum]